MLANSLLLLTDTYPIILVAHVAALIACRCITETENYVGGWASAGLKRGLVVVGNSKLKVLVSELLTGMCPRRDAEGGNC